MKRILLLSAYHAQSHQYWCESLIEQFPEYEWVLLTLPARYFAWRIRGNAISFLQTYPQEMAASYDLCITTSMVDLSTIKGLCSNISTIPSLHYFHENQFAYPSNGSDKNRLEPKMVNLYSAMAADKIVFNSEYNRTSFLSGVSVLMQDMPDYKLTNLAEILQKKSSVLPVPLRDTTNNSKRFQSNEIPKLLWNHRWEYDKNPELLFHVLKLLDSSNIKMRIAIIGQQFRHSPDVFSQIKEFLDVCENLQLENWGYIENVEEYKKCLSESTFVLSTAKHDFQGLSILEAVAQGCIPIVPNDLSYPEWFRAEYLYKFESENIKTAMNIIYRIRHCIELHLVDFIPSVQHLMWLNLHQKYDELLIELIKP